MVEISPNARPPVCKIIDFGKYKYNLNKKAKQAAQNSNVKKIKEIQFGLNIGEHDLDMKLKHGIEFLQELHNIRVVLKLKGRDMQRDAEIEKLMTFVTGKLKDHCKSIDLPKRMGRKVILSCTHL